jgi:hypothetical protein
MSSPSQAYFEGMRSPFLNAELVITIPAAMCVMLVMEVDLGGVEGDMIPKAKRPTRVAATRPALKIRHFRAVSLHLLWSAIHRFGSSETSSTV